MEAVLLDPSLPGPFRRSVRDKAGKVVRILVFKHREPQLLEGEDAAAIAGDIGIALIRPAVDGEGNPLNKPAREQPEREAFEKANRPKGREPVNEEAPKKARRRTANV